MKILIVEDDKTLNDGIAMTLGSYEVVQAYSIAQAGQFLDDSLDLAVLDINLPDGSGLDLCRRIKEKCSTSVIFLTANDMEIDVVAGLESGASDYITKPFSLAILRARVAAVLRDREDRKQEESCWENGAQHYADGKFAFDFEQMIFCVDGEKKELSKTEQKLLRLLVCNVGQTLRRESLLARIWPDGTEFVDPNALSVTMRRLREKLPGIPVRTVYGIGYVWEETEKRK